MSGLKVAFLGATGGMGRALSRKMAARGDTLCILGRRPEELEKSATDLRARAGDGDVFTAHCDLNDFDTLAPALESAIEQMGGLDTVVITAAMFGTQDALEADEALRRKMLFVNFTGTVEFCELARRHLLSNPGGGTLCVFSSVAGDRGRKPVALYGSTKAGLSHYLESLDHKHRADGLNTICVKPGFVKTGMTAGLSPPPFAGEPEQVANDVIKAITKGKPLIYTPGMWRWVMFVIKRLPRFVMRKIGF
ncbi:MAG: SDR family NAD(P)-dependent oxidoreductase [Bradymonadia bacterium]